MKRDEPAERIRYVYTSTHVERTILSDSGCELAVDWFHRSPGDPKPGEVVERVVDRPVVAPSLTSVVRARYIGRERRMSRLASAGGVW